MTVEERDAALAAVRAGRYADSYQACIDSHRRLLAKALAEWRLEPYPPTVEKVEMVAAVLKAGLIYLAAELPTPHGPICPRHATDDTSSAAPRFMGVP